MFPESTDSNEKSERRERQVSRFSTAVTLLMIVVCNAMLLSGVWLSGVNLDRLVSLPDRFNPRQDICLRTGWRKVVGSTELVNLCLEWIKLSDPSGVPHKFTQETEVKQDAQGRLYLDSGALVDYRMFVLVGFVGLVVALGVTARRYLVGRYRLRLEAAAGQDSSSVH
jgi:hypothetical protein